MVVICVSYCQHDNMSRSSVVVTRRNFFAYLDPDKQDELLKIVSALVVPGKGILGCHQVAKLFSQYIAGTNLQNNEETRRKFRSLMITTEGLSSYVSGLIIDSEGAKQSLDDGTNFIEAIRKRGFVPGIVVDKGVSALKGQPGEYITDGISALGERCEKYKSLGCNFAKWRSVFPIRNVPVSTQGLRDNARILARVALKCQDNGLVPIVEVDIMPIGDHSITRAQKVFETACSEVFKALQDQHVFLEGIILRSSFVTPGQHSAERVSPNEIARATLEALGRTVPPAIPGITLRGGGNSEEEATVLLNELNRQPGRKPWHLSFAFGRCLQLSAIKAWNGKDENAAEAQKELLQRAKANGEASLGKYVTGSVKGVASDFMMIIKDAFSY